MVEIPQLPVCSRGVDSIPVVADSITNNCVPGPDVAMRWATVIKDPQMFFGFSKTYVRQTSAPSSIVQTTRVVLALTCFV